MLAKYYWTGKKLFLVSVCVFVIVVDESSAKANLALPESDIFIFFAARARPALYAALDTNTFNCSARVGSPNRLVSRARLGKFPL